MRKTKIISTLGPASDTDEVIEQLIRSGTDVFRLNMSHAKHEWVSDIVPRIRSLSEKVGKFVAILMDLQGPAIRTGDLSNPLELSEGDLCELRLGDSDPSIEKSTSVNYPGLAEDLTVGDIVLVDNGVIQLKVKELADERISCVVLTDGVLGSRRHINLPGVHVRLPALTEKDMADAMLGVEMEIDFVGLSFAREAAHLEELRVAIEQAGSRAQIVAKIEDQQAMKHLDEIILASDVVMVARGDLGIEVNVEELPLVQRRIVSKCIKLGRRVIVATHMLESMLESPLPTRAEVTDVANAVYEQADAVMLSGETSVGQYPVKSVELLNRIATRNELAGANFAEAAALKTHKQKTVKAAVVLANSIPGCRIAVFTKRGVMANYVSNLRPDEAHVYAFSEDAQVLRHLCLNRAVTGLRAKFSDDAEETVARGIDELKRRGFAEEGDSVIVLSDVLGGEFVQDSIHLREIE
ncbi:MAG: pyruvate kinase [Verrucomicrobiota bacterium]|nr:pyruvate kinase [Verrucomicrobiota bacterium]